MTLTGEVLVFATRSIASFADSSGAASRFRSTSTARRSTTAGPLRRAGPSVGSAGPTTSSRMDRFTGPLLARGLALTIGKGGRSNEVRELLARHGAHIIAATEGRGGAPCAACDASRVLAYPELGPEAARMFTVDACRSSWVTIRPEESAFAENMRIGHPVCVSPI